MNMILSNAASLKPDLRLAEAISQFEASLSPDDKALFRTQRSQARQSAPVTADVMHVTAQIDLFIPGKARRCLGPRFTNFLSSVQQFAALGDVIVGGSQNIIACGIWSVVRMSILAITKYSSYIESISIFFMEIGRSSPRHQELALVYPQSKRLQANINEYFIIVVRFCHELFRYAQKSTFRQVTGTLSTDRIQETRRDLARWAQEINDELSLVVAKRIEEEALESSRFRRASTKFSKVMAEQQRLVTRLRTLDRCSKYDHRTTWKQIRKSGSTSTFAQSDQYKSWKSRSQSGALLYVGKLGCGKSVTLANMVDELILSALDHDSPVIYFFTRHDIPESLKARNIIGSLIRQLLESTEHTPLDTDDAYNRHLDVSAMCSLLKSCYSMDNQIWVILDGLDLCSQEDGMKVIEFLEELENDFCVRSCISQRQAPILRTDVVLKNHLRKVEVVLMPDNTLDISSFVEMELMRCLQIGSLQLGDAALILKIRDALLEGSGGMFLWVVLQIQTLCCLETDDDIASALDDLPSDLTETYRRILSRVQGKKKAYQELILQLITVAQRPLQVEEMREVLSVVPGRTEFVASKLVNDIHSILATCGCLIYVDEEDFAVRFVHPSVREYFVRACVLEVTPVSDRAEDHAIAACHRAMADVIVTYLSYGIFDSRVSSYRVPQIDGGKATSRVMRSAFESSKNIQSLALKLLSRKAQSNFDIGRTLSDCMVLNKAYKIDEFLFVHYAGRWCLDHVCAAHRIDYGEHIPSLLRSLLERNAHDDESKLSPKLAFFKAVEENNEHFLSLLLGSSVHTFFDSNFVGQYQGRNITHSPTSLAVCKGHQRLVDMLHERFSYQDLGNTSSSTSEHVLCYAAYTGHIQAFQSRRSSHRTTKVNQVTSFEHDIKFSHICQSGRGLLACAISGDDLDMIEYLLKEAKIELGAPHRHPVIEALRRKNLLALRLLRSSGKITLTDQQKKELISEATATRCPWMIPELNQFVEVEFSGTPSRHSVSYPTPPEAYDGRRPRLERRETWKPQAGATSDQRIPIPSSSSNSTIDGNNHIHAQGLDKLDELESQESLTASGANSNAPSDPPTSLPKSADLRSTSRLSSKPPPSPSPHT
ncbi:hypothetical protein HBI56_142100 [Parastagonospora nodorum]|uniref:NACHT domain-containing protein n=1 Tax=Phaeosphaeria nodorum (strain SN15 / ATCC MYA-4574 / FGSC 10173) TaxID=321614 RepID=A0A7U2F7D8_PHANO|nr:hypothetical protein HBH54_064480 [Parastagonospora nodorum]QRD00128.1 hypothetical protein JI435_070300 [Parastagonospora nodorum SN15]KAH4002111.1 hypothetical protein HBI10_081450 [Parastagonospora nodorum]KAH4039768.1 hypothetical protein HBI09_036510 [Parastagonospora nodorum]KAH4075779.1 hypothetical protein HBH50_021490 [Parastagonospora nodorum]